MSRNSYTASTFRKSTTNLALAITATLSLAALVVWRQSANAEKNNPPQGKFIDVGGTHLHYVERGTGAPVVLLHGNGSMVQDFMLSGVIEALAKEYRVIAFDRPGFGYSKRPRGRVWDQAAQADLIYQAMQQLKIDRPVVVGHSWGTMVATALGLAHPESVRHLILMSGYYYPTPRLDVPLVSLPAVPGIGTLLRNTVSPLLGRLMWPLMRKQLFSPAVVAKSFYGWPVWMTLRPAQLRASAADTAMMIPGAMNMSQRYADLTMPMTILAGDGDKVVNTDVQSRQLHSDVTQSELKIVKDAGHMVHHIAPETVIATIKEAMSGSTAETGQPRQAPLPSTMAPPDMASSGTQYRNGAPDVRA